MDVERQIGAFGKLDDADAAFARLKAAVAPHIFEREWGIFLVALNGVFEYLRNATKSDGKLAGWYGRIKNERKNDPLLSYLHQARHAKEHGLEPIVQMRKGTEYRSSTGSRIKVHKKTFAEGAVLYAMYACDLSPLVETREPPHVVLVPVTNEKFGDSFDPPTMHLGKSLTATDPVSIGQHGLTYCRRIVSECCALANPNFRGG